MTRRDFLRRAGGAAALPWIVPAAALGLDGAVAPSNRITVAGIGIGSRGTSDVRAVLGEKDARFVAVCDVRRCRRDEIKRMVDAHYGCADCVRYRDAADVFARRDVDAVVIATSDRWHANMAIMAMNAGKDVYVEKPSSMTVAEGQAVVATARLTGRVYQSGMQRLSEPNFVVANELLRLGRLGEVKTVYAHLAPGGSVFLRRDWEPAEPQPARDELDWDAWLGPCPWRPYNSHYVRWGWHDHHDLYSGIVGEWGSHTFAQCQAALGLESTSPVHYPCLHKDNPDGIRLGFANGVEMVACQNGWHGTCGVRYEGTEGWVSCADSYSLPEVSKPSLVSDYAKILADYCVRTGFTGETHMRQFLNAVRSRGRTVANPVAMHRSMTTVHCTNIAQWLGRDLTWDPVAEKFVGDDEANRMLARPQREGWKVVG